MINAEEYVQCLNIVDSINQEVFDLFTEKNGYGTDPIDNSHCFEQNSNCFIEEYPLLSMTTNGQAVIIEIYGIQIWNSEDDDRPYIDENADDSEKIDLRVFIKNQVEAYLNRIHQIHKCLSEYNYFKDSGEVPSCVE